MNDQMMGLAERYVRAIRGRMYFEHAYNQDAVHSADSDAWGIGHCKGRVEPVSVRSRDLLVICAAGMANHWGTRLFRLKYGLDRTEFGPVLTRFEQVAAQTSERLHWGDEELARFFAKFVLVGWLLDRPFRGKGEWKRRCLVLRKQLLSAELEAAQILASKLSH